MSSAAAFPAFRLELPWDQWAQQDRRFRRIQLTVLALVLILSALIAWLPAPSMLRPQIAPPPLPIQLVLKPRPPVTIAPKPVAAPAPATTTSTSPPKPVAPPKQKPQPVQKEFQITERSGSPTSGPTARERANAAGIGNLASQLSSLRDSSVASKAITGRPDLTGAPRPDRTADFDGGNAPGAGSERALITAKAGQSSGGINTAALSRGTGGGGLAGRGTTQVAGYGGGGNGSGPGIGNGRGDGGSGGGGTGSGGTGTGPGSGGGSGARSREEIEMIFDQNKGAIHALYNRALRGDPGLQGKLVLELTIQPNGTVTACRVVSMEFEAAEFKSQLVKRVMMFRFEDRDVAPVTTTKPIDFFPS